MPKNGKRTLKYDPVLNLRKPEWEVQNRESYKHYEYFKLYRDLGANRTFAALAAEIGLRPDHLSKVAQKWRWADRVAAWEKHIQELKDKEIEEAAKTMARRQAKLGMMLQEKAETALMVVDLSEPTVKDVVQLAEAGVKIERQARGENVQDGNQVFIQLPTLPSWAEGSKFIVKQPGKDEDNGTDSKT